MKPILRLCIPDPFAYRLELDIRPSRANGSKPVMLGYMVHD